MNEKDQLLAEIEKLRKRITTLEQHEQKRIKAEKELQAANQQLDASNQQLQANEQQLTAANQQLIASEQQLLAANQQLKASEIELKEANKKLLEAKEKAEKSEKYLENIIENISDPIFVKDEESKLLVVNDAFCQLFGLNKKNILGKNLAEDVSPEERESFLRIDKMVLKDGKENINEESITVRGGPTKIISTKKSRFLDKEGRKFLIGIIRDITERKQSEIELLKAKEKAEEADRLKTAFLANMSHEIRTPMNGILGFTNLLKTPDLSGEEQKQFIEIIQKSGNRMLDTVNDLIDISRIEARLVRVKLEQIDICHEIKSLYTFFKPEAEEKGLQFTMHKNIPDSESRITTDKIKFTSIITNLIKNAIKYTKEGSIEMECEHKGGNFLFHIKDTGIGIPQNRQKAIFKRFEQADINDTQVFEGSGLGLAITKAYVEMLDGKIWLESEEGLGSTFFFSLPWNSTGLGNPTIENTEIKTPRVQSASNLKILVAEDDKVSFEHMSIVLDKLAREIIHAETGIETVDLCRKNPDIDIILMDIRMPGLDGYEATRRIREFNKNVIIIAQTAYAMVGDRANSIQAGCNDYIAKPINKDRLLEKIKLLLKQK